MADAHSSNPILFREGDPTRVGYARVSTTDQSLDLQLDALTSAGCGRVYWDVASGATDARPGLTAALDHVRNGDTLTVWRLDRLGRSIRHLIDTVEDLRTRGVQFRSTSESIDTSTPGGELVFHVFAAMAQFERNLIRERTRAGLDAAKARGRKGGRKPSMSPAAVETARELRAKGNTLEQIAETLKVSRSSVIRALRKGEGS